MAKAKEDGVLAARASVCQMALGKEASRIKAGVLADKDVAYWARAVCLYCGGDGTTPTLLGSTVECCGCLGRKEVRVRIMKDRLVTDPAVKQQMPFFSHRDNNLLTCYSFRDRKGERYAKWHEELPADALAAKFSCCEHSAPKLSCGRCGGTG